MKEINYIILILALLFSCQSNENKLLIHTQSKNIIESSEEYDSTLVVINNIKYIAYQSQKRNLFVLNEKKDTIYQHPYRATLNFEFLDFNNDGLMDLLINQMSNVGGLYELVLFDRKSNKFVPVENFTDFPSPKKIKETNYYYSYHKSGCADANWDSDLFYIENNKAIKVGNISGKECETEEHKGIFVYKVNGEKEILKEKFLADDKNVPDKWDFIKKYWSENHKNF